MLSSKTSNQKALIALAWVCFFWGTTWIASKVGVSNMPAIQLCAIRQMLGGSLYLLFFIITKHPWPKGKQWGTIIMLSFLNFMLSNGLSTWGVQYISSGLGAIIGAIFPLWIVIITLFGGGRLPQKALLGMVMGFGGVCIIFYDHLKDFLNADFSFGIVLSVIATISWAFGTLYTKKHAANFGQRFKPRDALIGFQQRRDNNDSFFGQTRDRSQRRRKRDQAARACLRPIIASTARA